MSLTLCLILLTFQERKLSNARHYPPRVQRIGYGVLRMKATLFAVGVHAIVRRGVIHGADS
jgi:hypothetical protein